MIINQIQSSGSVHFHSAEVVPIVGTCTIVGIESIHIGTIDHYARNASCKIFIAANMDKIVGIDIDSKFYFWYKRTCKADWNSLADIKKTFNTVDYVGNDRYVFDIKGNNYRIVAIVLFVNKKVYMRFVGTHEEYNKIKDIKNI